MSGKECGKYGRRTGNGEIGEKVGRCMEVVWKSRVK
jgi:hypothetical protein